VSELLTDMLILAVGVRPENALAKSAGLALGERGGIKVDPHMRTSDENIYAVGDAVEVTDFVTGRSGRLAIGPVTDDIPGGHAGGDFGVMSAFVEAIATGDRSGIRSSAREALESHLMAFAAEESRMSGGEPVAVPS